MNDHELSSAEIRAINIAKVRAAWNARHQADEPALKHKQEDRILAREDNEMTIAEAAKETGLSGYFFSRRSLRGDISRRRDGKCVYLKRDEVLKAAAESRHHSKMSKEAKIARDLKKLAPKRVDPKPAAGLRATTNS